MRKKENEKTIGATNCNSCRPLQNEQNKMKKTYPEKQQIKGHSIQLESHTQGCHKVGKWKTC